jgi:hypothetical protein
LAGQVSIEWQLTRRRFRSIMKMTLHYAHFAPKVKRAWDKSEDRAFTPCLRRVYDLPVCLTASSAAGLGFSLTTITKRPNSSRKLKLRLLNHCNMLGIPLP